MNPYYYLDWLAMGASLAAFYFLSNQNRYGFASFIVANFAWIGVGAIGDSPAIVLGNLVFMAFNIRGFLKWSPVINNN